MHRARHLPGGGSSAAASLWRALARWVSGRRRCGLWVRAARAIVRFPVAGKARSNLERGVGCAWHGADAVSGHRTWTAVPDTWAPACLHAGDRLRLSGRQGWRPCAATDESHRLVRRGLCRLRHPRPSVRSKPYPGAEQGSLSRFGHRNFHQSQYGGDLFRFVRGGVVGLPVGSHAARDIASGRSDGGRC